MPKVLPQVELAQSRKFSDYENLIRELGFEDKFRIAMLRWCGVGDLAQAPQFWEVYLALINFEVVGVTGLYHRADIPQDACWLGWFGVLPHLRNQGIGSTILEKTKEKAREWGFATLYVFTDGDDVRAVQFYKRNKFELLGHSADVCQNATFQPDDLVLKIDL